MTLGDYTRVTFIDTVTELDEENMNNIDAKTEELDTFADDAESDMTAVENRATAIENDIDYPTTVKQKAIVDTGEDGGVEGGVFNGDFEYGSGSRSTNGWIGDEKYGWYGIIDAGSCEFEYDSNEYFNGLQSIKVSNTDVSGDGYVVSPLFINNRHPLLPSTKYRLSARVKTNNVATDAVFMHLAMRNSANSTIGSATSSKLSGDNDWTYLEAIFTSHADTEYYYISLKNGVAGNISDAWFDDIKLEQIDTQTVNTQVDEPVSVSIEGVTTTDNIDQYLETSGNTYTLTTAVDEGATHRQTFTPTADRGDSKHLLTKIQALVAAVGTGDWTLVVHDAANNVLASKTIVVGSMSTGDIDFDVPAILDVGTAYHFHITSTVADGTVTTTDANDLETVDYHAQFAKHTESPTVEANGSKLDLTGVKLLTGATITVNADGSGLYEWSNTEWSASNIGNQSLTDAESYIGYDPTNFPANVAIGVGRSEIVYKSDIPFTVNSVKIQLNTFNASATRNFNLAYSTDNVTWNTLFEGNYGGEASKEYHFTPDGNDIYVRIKHIDGDKKYLKEIIISANLDCQTELPIFSPSSEVSSETEDLVQNPIDISEDGYWQLTRDLTGWASRTITMLASEALFESQAVSDLTIYIYDSNGTTPWTWDERSGLVPPADRTSGVVMAKFHVGDNQIRSSVNDGSMKANINLAWNEESLRAAMNRLTELANLQYPIVIEVEDVPAIDLQDQPTGASAETGYTNDVTSLRQTAAATPAIAYTGLLPRENQFSEWLDITVICSDGDGTLQGKLYTVDGTLIETYADLENNPVLTISNPDYKYSRERLILQISASVETTSTAWSITNIKWRYQYNG